MSVLSLWINFPQYSQAPQHCPLGRVIYAYLCYGKKSKSDKLQKCRGKGKLPTVLGHNVILLYAYYTDKRWNMVFCVSIVGSSRFSDSKSVNSNNLNFSEVFLISTFPHNILYTYDNLMWELATQYYRFPSKVLFLAKHDVSNWWLFHLF
jgi:hypothetical protein